MALFKATVKSNYNSNGVKLEKGMSVEIAFQANPLHSVNGVKEVVIAFQRKYGIDIKKANAANSSYLEVIKIN